MKPELIERFNYTQFITNIIDIISQLPLFIKLRDDKDMFFTLYGSVSYHYLIKYLERNKPTDVSMDDSKFEPKEAASAAAASDPKDVSMDDNKFGLKEAASAMVLEDEEDEEDVSIKEKDEVILKKRNIDDLNPDNFPPYKKLLSKDLLKKLKIGQDFKTNIDIESTMNDINFVAISLIMDVNIVIQKIKTLLENIKNKLEETYTFKIKITEKKTIKLFPATTLCLYIEPLTGTRGTIKPNLFENFYAFMSVKDKPIISIDIYNPIFLGQQAKIDILKTLSVNYFEGKKDIYLPILTKEGFKIFNSFVYNSTVLGTYPINKSRDKKIMDFFTEKEAYETVEKCHKLFPVKSGYIFQQFLEHFDSKFNILKYVLNSHILENLRLYLNTFISILGDKIKENGRILKVGGEAIRHYLPESSFVINDMDVNIILKSSNLLYRKNLFIKNLICLYTIVKWINDTQKIENINMDFIFKFNDTDFNMKIFTEPDNLSIKCEGYESLYLILALTVEIYTLDSVKYKYKINIKPFDMHISTTNEQDIIERYPLLEPFQIYTLNKKEFLKDLEDSISALKLSNFDKNIRSHRRLAKGKFKQDMDRFLLLTEEMSLEDFEKIYKPAKAKLTIVIHANLDKVIEFETDIKKIFEFIWLDLNLSEFLLFNTKNKSGICDLYKNLSSTDKLYKNDSDFFINMINLITSLFELSKNKYKTIFIKTVPYKDKEIHIPETEYSTRFSLFSSDIIFLKWYTTDTDQHKLLNAKLYRQEALTFVEEVVCYELFRILNKCKIKKDTIVYRGINREYSMMKDESQPETQNFFLSTSVTKFVAEKFGKVKKITVNTEVPGIYFTSLFEEMSLEQEDECLFPPGIKIQKDGDDYKIIDHKYPPIKQIDISCNTEYFNRNHEDEDEDEYETEAVEEKDITFFGKIFKTIVDFFTPSATVSKSSSAAVAAAGANNSMEDEVYSSAVKSLAGVKDSYHPLVSSLSSSSSAAAMVLEDLEDEKMSDKVVSSSSSSSSSSAAAAALKEDEDEDDDDEDDEDDEDIIKKNLKLIKKNYKTLSTNRFSTNRNYIDFMFKLLDDIKLINNLKNLTLPKLQNAKDTIFAILLRLSKNREKKNIYYDDGNGKFNFGFPRYENIFGKCMFEYIKLSFKDFDIETELNENCTLLKTSSIEKPVSTTIRQMLNKFIAEMNNFLITKNIGELPKKGGETLRYITDVKDGGDEHTNDIDSELWFYELEKRTDTLKTIFPYVAASIYKLAELIKKYDFTEDKTIDLPENYKIEISSFKEQKKDDKFKLIEKEIELQIDNLKNVFEKLEIYYSVRFSEKDKFLEEIKEEYKSKHNKPQITQFILEKLEVYINKEHNEKLFSEIKTLFLQSLKDTVPYHISVRTNYVGAGCKKQSKTPIQKKRDKECVLIISIDIFFKITLKSPGKEDIYFYKKTSPYDFVFSKRGCVKGIEYDYKQQEIYNTHSKDRKEELKDNPDLDDKFLDPCSKYIKQRGVFLPPIMSNTQEFLNIIKLLQDYDRIETNKHKKDLKRTKALLSKIKEKYEDEENKAEIQVLIDSIDYKKGIPTINNNREKPVEQDGLNIINYFKKLLKRPELKIEITRQKVKELDMLPCDNQLCGDIPLQLLKIWKNYPKQKNSEDTYSLGIGEYLSKILDENPPKAIYAYV